MRALFIVIGVFCFSTSVFSQNVLESGKKAKSFVSSEYNRNSLTIVGLNFNQNLSNEVYSHLAGLQVPEKFYNNPLQNSILQPGVDRKSVVDMLDQIKPEEIAAWLNQNKVGQQILATWFNRQPDGSFNVDVLKERGLFNANDNDFIVASASKRGQSGLMDMGLQLVNQSYVLVFDFYNITTMHDYYVANKTPATKQTMNGYRAMLKNYLFKLDFNDSVAAVFFQDYWVSANQPDKQQRIEAFENAEFPFVFVSKSQQQVNGTQFNEGQVLAPEKQLSSSELLDKMVTAGLESAVNRIEKQNTDFRVKAMVNNVHPISAKIGKKEGLRFDQRYFVLENRQRNNGTIYSKRIGVVKSMKVVDNRAVTQGETESSEFYQIAGGKVDNLGMFLEQKNDVGLNVFLGTTIGGLPGFTGRAEYYISKVLGEASTGKRAKGLTSIKIYAEGAYGTDTYDEEYTFLRGSVGLSKDFYPLHFLHWGPFVGYGVESTTWQSTAGNISTDFIEAGLRAGINLAHNIQLVGSINYYMMLTSQVLDENKEVLIEDFDYMGFFDDRFGPGSSIGLRIMF